MGENIKKGKLIVIEGTDGSGKQTQTKLLVERLERDRLTVVTASFPQYGKKSAGLVEEYLNGKYGRPEEVNPYAASLFYALDRFDVSYELRRLLDDGHVVVLDRYVDSNAGHQGGKIRDPNERERFLSWLYGIEYDTLKIPKPDLVLILHVPAEIGQGLVLKKIQRLYLEKGTQDSHEKDLSHLKNAEESYLWLAGKFPQNHKVIECVEKGAILPLEEIHARVWSVIEPIILPKAG